jgi:selenocysteine-specific elongation factor
VHVVGTAGHVDHGKSTLVRGLTGTDPDRWHEEKRRGLTIDLGFAWTELPSGRVASFVDVPGHVRFLKNMLAGVGAVDAVVFVVAATEGWKPQSEEHLRILQLLDIGYGIVALTKADLVDAAVLAERRRQVEERTRGTFLAGAAIVDVDATSRDGVGTLADALDGLLEKVPPAADRERPRLWIDRAFTIRGAGTVVTGTLAGGSLRVGDTLQVVPGLGRGAAESCRIRALQCHGQQLREAGPGRRLAVNVTGTSDTELRRGQALVRPGQWEPTRVVDAGLQVLDSASGEVGRRSEYQLHLGSGSQRARLRVLGAGVIAPGERGFVRIHLARPLALQPGDRFVLRQLGRPTTVGGGEILDVAPVLPASRARPDRSVDRVVAEHGWIEPALLERLTGARRAPNLAKWVVDPSALRRTRHQLEEELAAAGSLGLDLAALDDRRRAVLCAMEGVRVEGGRAVPEGAVDVLGDHPLLAALDVDPFAPPDPRQLGVDADALRELVRRGLVVECGGIWFSAGAIGRAGEIVAALLARHPDGVTVSDVRAALGSTRRYVLPLLAHLDAAGVTRRRGDLRVGGARLPQVSGTSGLASAGRA